MRDPAKYAEYSQIIAVQDVPTATEVNTIASRYFEMNDAEFGEMICQANLTDTKTAIFQLTQASDAAGTGKVDVSGFTVTLTGTTAIPDQEDVISFNVHDLIGAAPTKGFVGCDCTTNENGDDVAAMLRASGKDYLDSSLP